jgi:hypothetical protein
MIFCSGFGAIIQDIAVLSILIVLRGSTLKIHGRMATECCGAKYRSHCY